MTNLPAKRSTGGQVDRPRRGFDWAGLQFDHSPYTSLPPETMSRLHFLNYRPHNRAEAREIAREIVKVAPPRRDLVERAARLEQQLEPASEDQAVVIVACAVDSFPNARVPNLAVYLETAAHVLCGDGFSAAVIATGLLKIVRTSSFAPTVAEMVEACEEVRRRAKQQAANLRVAARMVERAEAELACQEGEGD